MVLAAFSDVRGLFLYIKSGVLQGIPMICNAHQPRSKRRRLFPGLFHLVEEVRALLVPQRGPRQAVQGGSTGNTAEIYTGR